MINFIIKKVLPRIAQNLRPEIKTVEDATGFYIVLKIYVLGEKVFSHRVYLKRNEKNQVEPNQKIKL